MVTHYKMLNVVVQLCENEYIYSKAYLLLSSAGAGDAIVGKMNMRNKGRFILCSEVFEEELHELSLRSNLAILIFI